MKIEITDELTEKALQSKCNICGNPILPWHFWKYSKVQNRENFVHEKCLYPSKYEKRKL